MLRRLRDEDYYPKKDSLLWLIIHLVNKVDNFNFFSLMNTSSLHDLLEISYA